MLHSANAINALRARYPSLSGLPDKQLAEDMSRDARALEVVSGSRLFEEGVSCAGFPLVLEGEIRVARGSTNGRSLELYRVVPGEVCIVSAAGLLTHRPLSAHGTAVLNTRLDRRLADYLLGHGPCLSATHQAVADELGTVREIITLLLNRFAAAGAVKLGRERIEVIDAVGLRTIAGGHNTPLY